MPTEDDAKVALDTVSEQLIKLPCVTGLGIGTASQSEGATLFVYLDSKRKDPSARAAIPKKVEINRPDGSKVAVPVQLIEQDDLKFE
ncbi:hypothetical protein NLM16_27705 [Bradyrhizobium brasilense]|uniref:hypothetical protein n=1 Tax=Bradyrhizobium brasilense TaxID=1419277 RepID=UPI002877EF58|nr:hypothetical protein [Bradyrhizobium brasilense]MCP3417899.1 hypothetical protein [Bradyrhizobium brasilense]